MEKRLLKKKCKKCGEKKDISEMTGTELCKKCFDEFDLDDLNER
jgi:uncharacterized OB-fold protein